MIHLTSSKNQKPSVLSRRISAVGFGAVAAAALLFSTGAAEAGPKELGLLKKELAAVGATVDNATDSQLAAVVKKIIADNLDETTGKYKKGFNAGVVVGEALKTLAAVTETDPADNAGGAIAAAVLEALGTSSAAEGLPTIVGTAAKTAATSTKANPSQISAFVAGSFTPTTPELDLFKAAETARSSKTAVGEIIAGFASELSDDGKEDIALAAVGNTKLAGAVTEISRGVAALLEESSDIQSLAVNLSLLKASNTSKVAVGVISAQPDEAGQVTNSLVNNTTLNTTVVKGMSSYAKAVASVSDIEQISVVGALLARQIGANATGSSTGVAAGLAKTLAGAIIAKPASTAELNGTGALSADNRVDEVAEVAAYVVGGILSNSKLTSKNINSTVLNIIKGAISGATPGTKSLKETVTLVKTVTTGADVRNLWADVAGSVAATLNGTSFDTAELLTFLTSTKTLSSITKDKTLHASIKAAIELGLSTGGDGRLEIGSPTLTPTITALLTELVDRETDNKNF